MSGSKRSSVGVAIMCGPHRWTSSLLKSLRSDESMREALATLMPMRALVFVRDSVSARQKVYVFELVYDRSWGGGNNLVGRGGLLRHCFLKIIKVISIMNIFASRFMKNAHSAGIPSAAAK